MCTPPPLACGLALIWARFFACCMSPMWNGCRFGPAHLLSGWHAPRAGGIYAISHIVEDADGSRVHSVLYFGQSSDLSSRNIGPGHEKYECWESHADGSLYVSVHLRQIMAGGSTRSATLLKRASQTAIRPIRDLFRPPPCSCWCCIGQPTTVPRPGRQARPQAPPAGDRPAPPRLASTGRSAGPNTHYFWIKSLNWRAPVQLWGRFLTQLGTSRGAGRPQKAKL